MAANVVENSTTIESSQQLVATNNTEEDTQLPIATTGNSGRPKRGRKRKYLETDSERKLKRNGNKQYVNKDGKSVEPKVFRHDYVCPCSVNEKNPKKCTERVTTEDRHHCFNLFWNLGSYSAQNAYIAGAITETTVQRRHSKSHQRNFCRQYILHDLPVCRETFVKSLAISTKRVDTAMKKNGLVRYLTDEEASENHVSFQLKYVKG